MRNYATAQNIGGREEQCDATAVYTAPTGARAYVLLDGIGSTPSVRAWTRETAARVARTAARQGNAGAGLGAVHARLRAEREDVHPYARRYLPKACAVVAVTAPGLPLTVAWCGDSRAYVLALGTARRLTTDHNLRRVYPPCDMYPEGGNRHTVTSCLGSTADDARVTAEYRHLAIETVTVPAENCRLLLASDGAYEPVEDNRADVATYLVGTPGESARALVTTAVGWAGVRPDNATALVADLRP
ncbi:PP2C family protein-serine/threonine phosphatase [Streptomyces zaomyceticus]|uniref:PP2C family protein-serine/threonine phosphatase n=1 Tax=Streptomyces zaomyceticus TaxID=68286 RepID=UPI0037A46B0E